MQNQVFVFIVFILNGILIGVLFDCFRILRKSFKTPDFITYTEDITFGILSGILLLFSIMKFNNGELRFYLFLGVILGVSIYLFLFSKIFIEINVAIITFIKKIIHYTIVIPIKFTYKLFRKIIYRPIILVCINLKNKFKKFRLPKMKFKKKKVLDKL